VPQKQLKSQEIDYSRGKGLGGSTAINFSCWVIGPSDDFDEWAEKVGDDAWSWKNVKQRFGKIEGYHVEVPEGHGFVKPRVEGKFYFCYWKWSEG
jgi:choline dehydrogenase-like flavoprotein